MKLDRNLNQNGRGKYALVDLRKGFGVNDCAPGEEHEYFVLMLKDKWARAALQAYAKACRADGEEEFADEVHELSKRAGEHSKFCQWPD